MLYIKLFILLINLYLINSIWSSDFIENDYICNFGKHQSPINIAPPFKKLNAKIKPYFYNDINTSIVYNTGYYLEFQPNNNDYILFNNSKYTLKQLHFHIESEHSIRHNKYPMELHIVLENINNKLLVIGIMFDIGKENRFLKNIGWNNYIEFLPLPYCKNHICNLNDSLSHFVYQYIHINPMKLHNLNYIINNNKFYYYNGSTTTLPCIEDTKWLIMINKLEFSLRQYNYYKNMPRYFKKNNRKIQKLNGRQIFKII